MDGQRAPMPRAYWRLFGASGVSNLGDGVLLAALPLLAARATDSELSVGLVSAFFTLPWLVIGLPVGAVVDRVEPRRLMAIADLARGALVAALAVIAAVSSVEAWMLWLLALGLGVGEVVVDSASQAIVPTVVGTDQLERANGWRYSVELVTNTYVGLPVGGLLFTAAVWLPFGVDAASFVLAALLVASLPRAHRPPREHTPSLRTDMADGLRWLVRHGLLRDLTIALTVTNLAFAMIESTFVLYLTRELGLAERWFGVAVAVMATGGVIAGVASGRIVDLVGRRALIATTACLPVVTTALLATANSPVLAIALAAAQAALITAYSIVAVSLRQELVPEQLFGRVNGVYVWCSRGAMPLGALAGGVLAQAYGLRAPYAIAAVLLLAAASLVLTRVAPFIGARAA